MNKVFCVIGVMDSGSGSLTYPEDFEFEGFFETEKEAQDHADDLNKSNGLQDFGTRIPENEDGDEEDEESDEDEEGDYEGPTDETFYVVEEFKNLSKNKKGKKG